MSAIAQAQNSFAVLSGVVQDNTAAPFANWKSLLVVPMAVLCAEPRPPTPESSSFPSSRRPPKPSPSPTIATAGFKRYSESGIELEAGEQRTLDPIQLQLGEITETVSVTAEQIHVKLTADDRSMAMDQQQLADFTLQGWDVMDAVALLPGVADLNDGRSSPSSRSLSDIYILGGRSNQKNMTIDGITSLDTGSKATGATLHSSRLVAG